MGPLVLINDFGVKSPYPGQMGLAARMAGWSGDIVHLWHEWPPFRVDLGGVLLPRLLRPLPAGAVVIAVVDPGVGSDRRVLALEWGGAWWIAPDNGLLSGLIIRGADCFDLELYRPGVGASQTFHGRAWMIPAAVDLLAGILRPGQLPSVHNPVVCPAPVGGCLAFWDCFGNGVTTVPWDDGADGVWRGPEGVIPQVEHFSRLLPGKLAAVRGSLGLWEIAVVGGRAFQRLNGTLNSVRWCSK